MSFAAVTLKMSPRAGSMDTAFVRTAIVAIENDWTFNDVLSNVLSQEGLPPRAEFTVERVSIHDGDKVALAQTGSGWPKLVRSRHLTCVLPPVLTLHR